MRVPISILCVCIATGSLGVGRSARGQSDPVVHEYFEYSIPGPDSGDGRVPALPRPGFVAPGSAATPPPGAPGTDALVLSPDGAIPGPNTFDAEAGGLRNGPAVPDAEATFDLDTEPEGWLHYGAAYDPTVGPWKRSVARDQVVSEHGLVALRVRTPERTPVSVAGAPPAGFTSFTGRFTVLADAGEWTPVPSVAPDMRVHAVTVDPPAEASVARDGAGNYAVALDRPGRHHVTVQVSAPAFYFGGPIPETGATRAVPRLPGDVLESAAPVVDAVGVTPRMTELEAVAALTDYFRGFVAAPMPPELRSGDAYRDIALSRVGVCRHRALAFVVTAQAVGLAARYVHNEAHAFAEVYFTGLGWRRIDLGGASEGLTVSGDVTREHDPGEDPFGSSDPTGGGGRVVNERSESSTASTERDPAAAEPGAAPTPPGTAGAAAPTPTTGGPHATGPLDTRVPTVVHVATVSRAYRGETVEVTGWVRTTTGAPVADRDVTLTLIGERGGTAMLGTARTDADGAFVATVRLPGALDVGQWDLRASYAGDDDTAEAASP